MERGATSENKPVRFGVNFLPDVTHPPVQGGQRVELRWAVLRPAGGGLGTMTQATTV